MKSIVYLCVEVKPEKVQDLIFIKWRISDGFKQIGYDQAFPKREIMDSNDFKSVWDHVWEKAKFLVEEQLEITRTEATK